MVLHEVIFWQGRLREGVADYRQACGCCKRCSVWLLGRLHRAELWGSMWLSHVKGRAEGLLGLAGWGLALIRLGQLGTMVCTPLCLPLHSLNMS